MRRINEENINTPELTDNKFVEEWDFQLHTIDQERFDTLARYFEGGKYLDVGCFNSPKPGQLAETNEHIHALDHSPLVIETLSKQFPKVHYKLGGVDPLPYEDEYFDYVVAGEILEHMEDPRVFVEECMRVVTPGGWFALSTPLSELNMQAGVGGDEHLWSFEKQDIVNLLSPYGEVDTLIQRDSVLTIIAWVKKSK